MMKPKKAMTREQQFQFDLAFARRILMEKGEFRPMFILHCDEGLIPVMVPAADDQQKDLAYSSVAIMALAHNAHAVTFISEAWVATARPEDRDDPMRPGVRPRDREDRREILIVSYAWRDDAGGKHIMLSMPEIERRANGKVSGLASAPVQTEDADRRIESRLRSVIPDGPVHPEAQAAARRALDELFIMQPGDKA